jgi:hypothetical protein
VQTNGTVALVKSAASAAVVEAVEHARPNDNGSLAMTDRNEFVEEVHALIRVRPFSLFFHLWCFIHFHFPWFD